MDGQEINGRAIRVDSATERDPNAAPVTRTVDPNIAAAAAAAAAASASYAMGRAYQPMNRGGYVPQRGYPAPYAAAYPGAYPGGYIAQFPAGTPAQFPATYAYPAQPSEAWPPGTRTYHA